MDNLKLYAVLDKSSDVCSNVFISSGDVEAGRFMVQNFKEIYKDVPKDLKSDFQERINNTCIVKLGEIDLVAKNVIKDYNLICDFNGFKFDDEVKTNESREDSAKA